jgi:hypothetical protein
LTDIFTSNGDYFDVHRSTTLLQQQRDGTFVATDTDLFRADVGGAKSVLARGPNGSYYLVTEEAWQWSEVSTTVSVRELIVPLHDYVFSGKAYQWKTGALLSNVTITASNGIEVADYFTDSSGNYSVDLPWAPDTLTALKTLTNSETGTVISSSDALAALKIAVGLNPNADPDGEGPQSAPPISPYQFLAADVNEDGKVTSADALAILKMAVKLSDAPAREWLFVDEQQDFWNEITSTFTTTRSTVPTPADLAITVDTLIRAEVNLVAILKGGVNGSWVAPEASQSLTARYFYNLASDNQDAINVTQFGVLAV